MGNILDCSSTPHKVEEEEVEGEKPIEYGAVAGVTETPAEPTTSSRLLDSIIWKYQREFYEKLNIKAWRDAIVPNFVTSNSFIANCYARVIVRYIKDCAANGMIDPSKPVYIVEVGAGSGKFGYLLAKVPCIF